MQHTPQRHLKQQQQQQQRAVLLVAHGLKENVAKLAPVDTIQQVTLQPVNHSIPNAPGKKASVAIYAHLAAKYGGKIHADAAKEGLELYGEYVEEAKQVPGSHPNIDILLEVLSGGKELSVEVQQQ
ncbi:hypothetical protein OEZ85_012670 [Tetradesmus obliquus]|uniref:DUF2322 family protein n=1 Tax=Tetradesmus obliquus TaxID=3088 RepID=A0ABY8U5J6_TETOB|nr:hypothetical protein OEZ85_012670 [Tetradesmus obliquus]